MKKLFIALLLAAPLSASAGVTVPTPTCSTEITYTIKDANGNVMDRTAYVRNWPIDCVTSVKLKYLMLKDMVGNGEARFTELTSGQ